VQSTGPYALHLLKEACIPSLKSIQLKVTELCSGQALGDADNDADTADKSYPYMSPFQGDTKSTGLVSFNGLMLMTMIYFLQAT
jgi:hypothetical protein